MTRRSIRRALTGLASAVVAVGLALGLAVTPAQAVIVETDRPRIATQQLDFGRNWALGAPLNGGDLYWDLAGGQITLWLTGNLYINNGAGTCARMRLEGYNGAHQQVVSQNGGTVCADTGALHVWSVNFITSAHSDIVHAHVKLQVLNANGSYSTVGTEVEDL